MDRREGGRERSVVFHRRGTEIGNQSLEPKFVATEAGHRYPEKNMALLSVESKLARLAVDISGPVTRITLRHPSLNVIDVVMMEELSRVLAEIEPRTDVSIVVLSGEGKSFSAGVDVAAHTPDSVEEMLGKFHAVIRALVASRKVTLAAVQGNCFGGGAELAMVCDIVYTTASARWGFPEIKLGCYPPVACTALAALVGQKRAAELILTGRTITGADAAAIGLANRSVNDERLSHEVDQTVRDLSTLSAAALATTKKALYAWDAMHFDKGLARAEKLYLDELIKTADAQEGIQAFMEKREPQWKGK
jgi:cyclohexa-1,5-dienecarbonyl-CoA hydratase